MGMSCALHIHASTRVRAHAGTRFTPVAAAALHHDRSTLLAVGKGLDWPASRGAQGLDLPASRGSGTRLAC